MTSKAIVALLFLATAITGGQELPRFRSGANLVNVDAYITKDGKPVTDLKPDEIEILEDDQPQKIEATRLVAGGPARANVFTLFVDALHIGGDLDFKAAVSQHLGRVIDANDRINRITNDALDPREKEIELCYPETDPKRPDFRGIAKAMIERRRERKTLQALDELITQLSTVSDERKPLVLVSEGWTLFRQSEPLGAVFESTPKTYDRGFASCERERSTLAFMDDALEVRQLSQRANRANVTFHIIDPRALTAPAGTKVTAPATPQAMERLSILQGGLRELAGNTGGTVLLGGNDVKVSLARMTADLGAYYVMQYFSTNTKLDGRFRSLTVRVKRLGVQVRARPGYLAPSEADARTAGVAVTPPALPPGVLPIFHRGSMTALRRGPSTGLAYVVAEQPRFRRTERLRVEFSIPSEAATATGRVLTSKKQPTPLVVSYSTQQTDGQTFGIADVILAPLAIGAYALELSYEVKGTRETAIYQFQIVP